jgi:Fe-S-cluster-containing dehydrogenase component
VRVEYKPMLCNHCEKAPCIEKFPEVIYKREDGLVIIDPIKAKGVEGIEDACPYGYIYYNDELGIAQKCTGCAHLLDNGWDVPRCVDACATEALLYVDEEEAKALGAVRTPQGEATGSKIWYLNIPKRFVVGTLVDIAADEVVIGAKVELLDAAGAVVAQLETDDFGDFKFGKRLERAETVLEKVLLAVEYRLRNRLHGLLPVEYGLFEGLGGGDSLFYICFCLGRLCRILKQPGKSRRKRTGHPCRCVEYFLERLFFRGSIHAFHGRTGGTGQDRRGRAGRHATAEPTDTGSGNVSWRRQSRGTAGICRKQSV